MLTRLLTSISLAFVVAISGTAWSSDSDMAKSYTELLAKSYAELFAPVKGAGAGKALHLVKPDAFIEKVKAKEPLVVLDVRTPAETGVYGVTLSGALMIPISELFTPANLARIPTDKTVIVPVRYKGYCGRNCASSYRIRECLYSQRRIQGPGCLHESERGEYAA